MSTYLIKESDYLVRQAGQFVPTRLGDGDNLAEQFLSDLINEARLNFIKGGEPSAQAPLPRRLRRWLARNEIHDVDHIVGRLRRSLPDTASIYLEVVDSKRYEYCVTLHVPRGYK